MMQKYQPHIFIKHCDGKFECGITILISINSARKCYNYFKDERKSTLYFYSNYVLQFTPGFEQPGTLRWQLALILTLTWIIVFFALIKGIQSLGKVK